MRPDRWRLVVASLAVVAGVVVWSLSWWLFPYHSLNHDEAVYLQQAGMLLEAQLELWPPVDGVMRPWFFVEDGPRLYPKYAPAPAAIFALGEVLGGYRLALAGVAGANVALVALVVREVFDRPTGLLAGAFVLASPLFLIDSAVFLPYAPTMALNLGFAYAYLRADRSGDRRWAGLAGAAIGLAFFSRPYTAVLFAAPFVVHALWTLRRDGRLAAPRQAATAATGSLGVLVTLLYNAAMTGSPWWFPYEAFAPLDGLGFGRRELLGHGVNYTPELALRTNLRVADLLFTEWVAGGFLGTAAAGVGLGVVARRAPTARVGTLAGLFASVLVGNVVFWGNLNLLGAVEVPGDGLVAVLGPYYHFDLLLPTSAFASRGAIEGLQRFRSALRSSATPRTAQAAVVVVVVVAAVGAIAVTAEDLDERVRANSAVTETYSVAYEPFAGGPPANSVVLVPTPYGDWLNHPFQVLRNEPGFDGQVVYAIDDRPFAVADAYPERRLYRYSYRGIWAPTAGSPTAARLDRVHVVSGRAVTFEATVGVPEGAIGVTTRVAAGEDRTYDAFAPDSERLDLRLTVSEGRVAAAVNGRRLEDGDLSVAGRDVVRATVFVDYGGGDGATYRFDIPVEASGGHVRALSPRVELCRRAAACGGSAAYVPGESPPGTFVRSNLEVVATDS